MLGYTTIPFAGARVKRPRSFSILLVSFFFLCGTSHANPTAEHGRLWELARTANPTLPGY